MQIVIDDANGIADCRGRAVIEPHSAIAEIPHLIELMRDEDQRHAAILHLLNLGDAFLRKLFVADRQDLIDQQNLGIDVHGHGESEPDVHARRVGLHRLIDEFADARELDDRVEALLDLALGKAEHDAVDDDVLAAGDLGMKPCAQFDQRGDATVDAHDAVGGLEDSRDDFQQRRFSRSVPPDDAERFSAIDDEGNIGQRRDTGLRRQLEIAFEQRAFEGRELRAASPQPIALRDILDRDGVTQIASANVSRNRSNTKMPNIIDASAYATINSVSESPGRWPKNRTS